MNPGGRVSARMNAMYARIEEGRCALAIGMMGVLLNSRIAATRLCQITEVIVTARAHGWATARDHRKAPGSLVRLTSRSRRRNDLARPGTRRGPAPAVHPTVRTPESGAW